MVNIYFNTNNYWVLTFTMHTNTPYPHTPTPTPTHTYTHTHTNTSHTHTPGDQITIDLPEHEYKFPPDVATTDSHPDMVIWSEDSIVLVELTIPFKEGMEAATERKRSKYADLLTRSSSTRCAAHLNIIKVGSRGFINAPSFDNFYSHLAWSKQNEQRELELEVTMKSIQQSHKIWCQRNWSQ